MLIMIGMPGTLDNSETSKECEGGQLNDWKDHSGTPWGQVKGKPASWLLPWLTLEPLILLP